MGNNAVFVFDEQRCVDLICEQRPCYVIPVTHHEARGIRLHIPQGNDWARGFIPRGLKTRRCLIPRRRRPPGSIRSASRLLALQ